VFNTNISSISATSWHEQIDMMKILSQHVVKLQKNGGV